MKPRRLERLGRLVAGDDNPLRRNVDKLESAIMVGLVVAFLIAAPLLSVFAVRAVGGASTREQRAQSLAACPGSLEGERQQRPDWAGRRVGYLLGVSALDHAKWH